MILAHLSNKVYLWTDGCVQYEGILSAVLQNFILKGARIWIGVYFKVVTAGCGASCFVVRILSKAFISSTHYFHPLNWKAIFSNWKQENSHIKNHKCGVFFALCSVLCSSALMLKQVQLLAVHRSRCFYPVIVGLFFRAMFNSTDSF